jgi:integrase
MREQRTSKRSARLQRTSTPCVYRRGSSGSYVVVVWDGQRQRRKSAPTLAAARDLLAQLRADIKRGTFEPYGPQENVRFGEWADRWLAALERKETTRDSYSSTIALAKQVFGGVIVRNLRPQDVAAFNDSLRRRKLSDSTRAKHLRVLGACLRSAVQHGFATRNVVKDLPKSEKPRPQRKEAAYFTDEELPRLFAEIPAGLARVLLELALKTGMREGELLALTWGDVDLVGAVVRVRRTYTDGHLGLPKNHERRDVDLTPDLVELLGAWWGERGRPGDDKLVFPGEGGYLSPTTILRRVLYPAMKRAAIEREGPTGEKRTFHSLRHTFARIALESGGELTWLSRHLGHSSTMITDTVYGHWARAARKLQAAKLNGAFAI